MTNNPIEERIREVIIGEIEPQIIVRPPHVALSRESRPPGVAHGELDEALDLLISTKLHPSQARPKLVTNSPADAAVRGSSRSSVELYGRRATGVRLAQFELWCRPEWSCRPRQGARHHDRGGDRRTGPASHRGL